MALKGLLWILDDMAVGTLANCIKLEGSRRWPNGRLALMEATAQASEGSDIGGRKRSRKSLLSAKFNGSPVFQVIAVPVDGPVATMLFGHLRARDHSDANLAEHQAIAWAFNSGRKAVLVTQDQRAAMTALSELGRERVAHPVDLWLFLMNEGCVSRDEFSKLCWASVNKDKGLPGVPMRLAGKVTASPR